VRQHESIFTRAYEEYYGKLIAFTCSRTGDALLPKDIVASVVERAYVKGREVREPAAYGSWLFMIAKNLIAGHYRRVTGSSSRSSSTPSSPTPRSWA
jgi:DNA-directed RNA polymerase specialized sigma24 family protein